MMCIIVTMYLTERVYYDVYHSNYVPDRESIL